MLVDHEGRVKVADFGIARAGSSQMTEAGSIIGTAQYLSPEQARGAPVDESSDLYSTGIVLYELLTGKVPFTGETPVEIAMKHLSQVPEAPSTIRPEIPRDLDLVVLRALAKEPAERYRTAKEMDRDLELVGRGEAVGPETEEAATMVLRGETTAATAVRRPGARRATAATSATARTRARCGAVARGGRGSSRLGAAIAIGIGAWLFYDNVQDELDANDPVVVDNYEGILEENAVKLITGDGFEPKVIRLPERDVKPQYVFEQEPTPGTGLPKGHRHDPRLDGQEEDRRAVARREVARHRSRRADERGLDARRRGAVGQDTGRRHRAGSAPGTVSSRALGADQRLEGAEAGRGPERRRLELRRRRGAAPARRLHRRKVDVESDRPAGEVVDQTPPGNSTATRGSPVTLSVSRGRRPSQSPTSRSSPSRTRGRRCAQPASASRSCGRRPTTRRSTASSCRRIRPAGRRPTPTRSSR